MAWELPQVESDCDRWALDPMNISLIDGRDGSGINTRLNAAFFPPVEPNQFPPPCRAKASLQENYSAWDVATKAQSDVNWACWELSGARTCGFFNWPNFEDTPDCRVIEWISLCGGWEFMAHHLFLVNLPYSAPDVFPLSPPPFFFPLSAFSSSFYPPSFFPPPFFLTPHFPRGSIFRQLAEVSPLGRHQTFNNKSGHGGSEHHAIKHKQLCCDLSCDNGHY